jgi:hypothetical protein
MRVKQRAWLPNTILTTLCSYRFAGPLSQQRQDPSMTDPAPATTALTNFAGTLIDLTSERDDTQLRVLTGRCTMDL